MSFELFPFQDGFGYIVSKDGVVCVYQEYDPELPGFVVMNEQRAIRCAEIVVARLG